LLSPGKDFKLEGVYYSEEMIFICLAFLSLLSVKNINQANTIPCGELGRAMGLDRIPEVKTLRERVAICTYNKNVKNNWPQEDFIEYEMVDQQDGTMEKIRLAEKKIILPITTKKIPKKLPAGST